MTREEAINEIKSWAIPSKKGREVLETLIPELRESDEETTRKELLNFVRSFWADHKEALPQISRWITYLEKQKMPEDMGEISDGYHTFNELYYYRMLYNAAFFNLLPKEWVHKSKKHHDGEECFGGGWFIVMANLPTGQVSNHYELKDWDLFQIPEKDIADEWDGHTPQEAAERLYKYLQEKQKEQKRYWKPTEADVALFNKAVITNKALTPIERAQLDIIRTKFGYCRAINCSGIIQEDQKLETFNEPYNPNDYEVVMEGNAISLKRKEQKPVDYDHEMWKNCEANFEGGKKEVLEHPEKYGLQKEQKLIDNGTREKIISRATTEKQVVLVSESSGNAEIGWDTRSLEDTKKLLEYGLAFINKQLGTKPAEWSEEDKDYYDTIVRKLEVIGDDSGLSSNQIKFLREHCPLSHSEWSEKDETIIEGACSALEVYGHTKLASMLKSLRPSWKPSEEQMEALEITPEYFPQGCPIQTALISLYEQLKKL